MLDTDTKRRIDTARDILVGKVPDPKSQVEQITIALIYKFMDDMDAESEEMGGSRKFFANDYARYGWAKLMRSGLGGHETLNLYAEAIAKMPENPGIPSLFREIFKNAYLPYRDPETLRAFLKIIDEFEYDHSERLGDAFEYLLSVLGSQGDAGQFRTPRHIIDFMVEVVDPKKTEAVLDPACGTAGFLISSYKHILKVNMDASGNGTLTPEERGRLAEHIKGYDISPDMVRLSLVNLYLHGFIDPHIIEYDTLTSQDRWGEYADVILANPPFMSPKGGIKPHNRFSVQSKRSEVLFVDYITEHLMPNGRAGIIVPEGVIFQSQTAYKQLRKLLVEESLVAVISLPAGVFNPYSGVKTSILILDKALAKQSTTIGFFRIDNDGFGLGAQRRSIDKDDLPRARSEVAEYLRRLGTRESTEELTLSVGLVVSKEKIAENGEYNLSVDRYRSGAVSASAYPLMPVGQFMKVGVKTVDPRDTPDEIFELWSIPAFDAGHPELSRGSDIGSQKKLVTPGDVLLSRIIPHIRRGWVVRESAGSRRQIASTEWIVFSSREVVPEFLRQLLVSDFFHVSFMRTITGVGGSLSRANPGAVGDIRIPVPPLEKQSEIVAEIEGYQRVIDGARAVVDNYRPYIPIHPDWPLVELSDVVSFQEGPGILAKDFRTSGVPLVRLAGLRGSTVTLDGCNYLDPVMVAQKWSHFRLRVGDILVSTSATFGRPAVVTSAAEGAVFYTGLIRFQPRDERLDSGYLKTFLGSRAFLEQGESFATGSSIKHFGPMHLKQMTIPLPPIRTQQRLVAEIEAEQELVAFNRELITRFDKKIQDSLGHVWGEEESALSDA